jgi:hypothetical protein
VNNIKGRQYMPFDALDGYMEEIEKRNVVYIDKPILSTDMCEDIDLRLRTMRVGDIISFKYYKKGGIYHMTGEVIKINKDSKSIKIAKSNIKFNDILEIY